MFFFSLSKNEVKVKRNVCRRNVCSTEIPLSLLAGKEKHHDNRSQRLKHQLAAANEASLASAIFPTISLSCSTFLFLSPLFTLVSTLLNLKHPDKTDVYKDDEK